MSRSLKELEFELMAGINRSYSEFKEYHSQMIRRITEKVQKTPVYRDRIKVIDDVERINELPLTFYDDIASAIKTYGLKNCLLKPYKVEVQTTGSTGNPKKFYYEDEDFEKFALIGKRCGYSMGLRPGDTVWSLTAPLPYISGLLLSLSVEKRGNLINTSITTPGELIKGLKRISKVKRKVKAIYGFPAILMTVAQISNDPQAFKGKVEEKIKEKLRFGKFLSKAISSFYLHGIDYKRIKDITMNVETVISGGEPLGPYRERLSSLYPNAEFFEVYGSTELGVGMAQLLKGGYLHPMLDWFVPEIADIEEIRKAKINREYGVKAVPWWEWYEGLKGELIITRDGGCLPLIRYPTGDVVEVINPRKNITLNLDFNKFKIVLPEVRILGRSVEILPPDISEDEMLTFSVARVYPSEIKEKLSKIPGLNMRHYNLYVYRPTRSRPFPKWKLEIIPEEKIRNKEKLEKDIKHKLIKETELHQTIETVSIGYPEYAEELFQVRILEPEAYKQVEEEVYKRIKEKRPLGQIKPKHIHFIKES